MAGVQTKLCKEINLTCSVHCQDLLPLFCKDCNHLMCCECIAYNHVGHKLCNVSKVVKDHKRALQNVLNNEKLLQFLKKRLVDSQGEQNRLAQHTEDLLRNVMDREEEIITKVKIWRENKVGAIVNFEEQRSTYLKEKIDVISIILNKREKGFPLESERSKLEITHINCEVRRLLNSMQSSFVGDTSVISRLGLERGCDSFHHIFGTKSEKELSLSGITSDDKKTIENIRDCEDEEDDFHDSVQLHRYKFRTDSIQGIIPLQNLHTFILCSGTVYLCDLNKHDFHAKTILSDVYQIAHISTFGDVLCVMKGFKEIKRIANGNVVTTFLHATLGYERFKTVSSGHNEAYACVSGQSTEIRQWVLHIFNELGVILKTFHICIDSGRMWGRIENMKSGSEIYVKSNESGVLLKGFDNWMFMKTMPENNCICAQNNIVQMVDFNLQKTIRSYTGSVGTDPGSRFCTTGMTTDNNNNILLAVYNDNAIHLLDSSLTFQKLLMTDEDGLHCPVSVALDREGYLWVGCEDGQLHVVNYQYLLNTDRQTRLKLR